MPPAARIGDTTLHDGEVISGCDSVVIGNSQAARHLDAHCCEMTDPDGRAHVGGDIVQGSESVIICNMPAARLGDECICYGPPVTADIPPPSSDSPSLIDLETESRRERDLDITEAETTERDQTTEETHQHRHRDTHDSGEARLTVLGRTIAGISGEANTGIADDSHTERIGPDGRSTQGSMERRSGNASWRVFAGSSDDPTLELGGTGRGPGQGGRSRLDTTSSGIPHVVSGAAGAEYGSVSPRIRSSFWTGPDRTVMVDLEGTGGYGIGGAFDYGTYYDEAEDRRHFIGGIDSTAAMALIGGPVGALGLLVASPFVGHRLDISFGRAYGADTSDGGGPGAPPFAAGPNEIVTGEESVLIGG